MRPDVHLHPDRLHGHAAAALDLSDGLLGSLRRAGRPSGPGAESVLAAEHAAELERLDAAVRRAVGELADLAAALLMAAAAATEADAEAVRAFRRVADELAPHPARSPGTVVPPWEASVRPTELARSPFSAAPPVASATSVSEEET